MITSGRLLAHRLTFGLLLSATPVLAVAVPISYGFSDPLGDNATTIDLIGMDFEFDNSTGDYVITMRASAADPFRGELQINVNIFNPDTGTTAEDPAFFQDVVNVFSLATPVTELVLAGTSTRLLSWSPGDVIAVGTTDGLGNPDGTSNFQTGVLRLDAPPPRASCNEDFLATSLLFFECLAPPAAVAEPATIALLGLGPVIVGLVRISRARASRPTAPRVARPACAHRRGCRRSEALRSIARAG